MAQAGARPPRPRADRPELLRAAEPFALRSACKWLGATEKAACISLISWKTARLNRIPGLLHASTVRLPQHTSIEQQCASERSRLLSTNPSESESRRPATSPRLFRSRQASAVLDKGRYTRAMPHVPLQPRPLAASGRSVKLAKRPLAAGLLEGIGQQRPAPPPRGSPLCCLATRRKVTLASRSSRKSTP